jgi:outer membrane receptor protein involved in Fe transport
MSAVLSRNGSCQSGINALAWFACLCGLIALLVPDTPAYGQASTGGIRGIVKDETGAVLPGVSVEASSPARIGGGALTQTNSQGLYRFERLPIGTYTVSFALPGFTTLRRENVRVEVGRAIQLDLTMTVSAVEETVTVTAETPVVDTLHSGSTTTFSDQLLDNIPTTRGNVLELSGFAPGIAVNGDPVYTDVNVHGSTSDQNSYQIEGLDLAAPSYGGRWDYPSYNIIEEMEVKSVGASAEYTGFQGGVINIVTKSGSNTWSGFASSYFINQSLVGNNTPEEEYPYHVDYQWEGGVGFGGPIKKDRVWVYGILTRNRTKFTQVGVDPQFGTEQSIWKPYAKLTAMPSERDNIEVTFNDMEYSLPNSASRTRPVEATRKYLGGNPTVVGRWTRTFGANTVFQVKAGHIHIRDRYLPISEDVETPGHYDLATGMRSVNHTNNSRSDMRKTSVDASLTHYANDFIKGSHDFKFGVQVESGKALNYANLNGGMAYYDANTLPYYAIVRDPRARGGRVREFGVFAQENWTVNDRLTLNLGVRVDHVTANIPEIDQLDFRAEEKTGVTFPGVSDVMGFNNITPRLGFTVKLDSVGKTVAKASFGRYFGTLRTNMFRELSPGETTMYAFLFNPDTGQYDIPFYSVAPSTSFSVDPDLKNQYTDQFFVGMEREVLPGFGVDVSFMYKKEHDLIRMRDITGVYAPETRVDTFRGQTQTLEVYNLATPLSESIFQVVNRNDMDRGSYKAVVLQGYKRWSNSWQMQGSYTWQRTLGYTTGEHGAGAQDFGYLGTGGFGRDPNDLINAFGRLPSDQTHAIRISSSAQLPYDFSLGVRYGYTVGRPYSRRITVRGLSQGVRTVVAEPGGSYFLPSVNDLQIRVEKVFRLGEARRLRLSADFLNALNSVTVVYLRNNSSQTGDEDFGQSTRIMPPRQVMLGVRFEF